MNTEFFNLGLPKKLLLLVKEKEPLILGRIIEHHKDRYLIMTRDRQIMGRVTGKWMIQTSDPREYPTIGDYVFIDDHDEIAIIHELLPRYSVIERKVAGLRSDTQLIAANVDVIFICQSMNENFNKRRLERYLAMAWSSGATPVVLLTKRDLSDHPDLYQIETENVALGVDVITCSDQEAHGYDTLDHFIKPGKTYVFIGSSGVGKSTIINHLMKHEVMDTKDIGYLDRGKHTTTYRSLFITEHLSMVIDTPGMREIGLDHADFDQSFSDIISLAKDCKFNDCTHTSEPGCAIKQKMNEGLLDPSRLINYQKMLKELKHNEQRQKYLERQREKKMRQMISR